MERERGITRYFGTNLAEILSKKIQKVHKDFPSEEYIAAIDQKCGTLGYTQRIKLHAEILRDLLPIDFVESSEILVSILGAENPEETGMFTNYYWVMPIGKYVEVYGHDHFDQSMHAIEEITKRNTGEYAIRPFIRLYPDKTLSKMTAWAKSTNFHLRRLSSEGLRPKLPWATKLDTFIEQPERVFDILEILKEDEVMFVKKSVANHLIDWLKVNRQPTTNLLKEWRESGNRHTQWIVKRATRKIPLE